MSTFRVTVSGRLGADPELRFTPDGKAHARARLAHSGRVKDPAGQWVDGPTLWLTLTAFGHLAEQLAEQTKGALLLVTGRATPTEYTDRAGQTVAGLDVVADDLGLIPTVAGRPTRTSPPADTWPPTNDRPPF
jgi:single-strand DNA-binding protein